MLVRLLFHHAYRRWRFRGAFALYGLIIALGTIPDARQTIGVFAPGLVLHILAYGTLTFLLFTGLEEGTSRRQTRAFLIVAAMGALDELVQSFLPYRVGSMADWLIDISAAAAVLASLRRMR